MKIKDMRKGKAVPLSDTELTAEAVKDEFCKRGAPDAKRVVYGVQVEKLVVHAGRTGGKDPDPRTFMASGKIHYKILKFPTNRLVRVTNPASFSITFKDGFDDLGQPDVRITDYAENV